GSATVEISRGIQSGMDQIVAALGRAASSVDKEGLPVAEMTEVLKTAFSNRNRFDAALSGAIGALDKAAQRVPDEELTGGLSCADWLSESLRISSSAG